MPTRLLKLQDSDLSEAEGGIYDEAIDNSCANWRWSFTSTFWKSVVPTASGLRTRTTLTAECVVPSVPGVKRSPVRRSMVQMFVGSWSCLHIAVVLHVLHTKGKDGGEPDGFRPPAWFEWVAGAMGMRRGNASCQQAPAQHPNHHAQGDNHALQRRQETMKSVRSSWISTIWCR